VITYFEKYLITERCSDGQPAEFVQRAIRPPSGALRINPVLIRRRTDLWFMFDSQKSRAMPPPRHERRP
jgi:hypothetical protein